MCLLCNLPHSMKVVKITLSICGFIGNFFFILLLEERENMFGGFYTHIIQRRPVKYAGWLQTHHFFDFSFGGGFRGIKKRALIGCMSHNATKIKEMVKVRYFEHLHMLTVMVQIRQKEHLNQLNVGHLSHIPTLGSL